MALYALGDPHLAFGRTDRTPGGRDKVWRSHEEKLRRNWLSSVTEADTVVPAASVKGSRLRRFFVYFASFSTRHGVWRHSELPVSLSIALRSVRKLAFI